MKEEELNRLQEKLDKIVSAIETQESLRGICRRMCWMGL